MKERYEIEYSWGKYANLEETLIVETLIVETNDISHTINQLGRNRINFKINTIKSC